MNFPFYIAKRYLVSKKSQNAINIISIISMAGVAMGTMGLIVVLSVFNGFVGLIDSMYNAFDPDISITIKEGKTFDAASVIPKLQSINGIQYISEVIEENALVKYGDKQCIATIKGVGNDFSKMTGIDTLIIDGHFILKQNSISYATLGANLAGVLNISLQNVFTPLEMYVPKRGKQPTLNPDDAFSSMLINPSGVFSIEQEFDSKYIIVPVSFARQLMDYTTQATSIELGLAKNVNSELVEKQLISTLGDSYIVKNRFQQRELLYKIMKSEKWAVFLILSFILLIATFNVVASISMLIIDKKNDIQLFTALGASQQVINKIFVAEGLLITLIGAGIGLVLGFLICFLQQTFGLISMGSASFIVDAYPIDMQLKDFLYVFGIVIIIGAFAALYPTKGLLKNYLKQSIKL